MHHSTVLQKLSLCPESHQLVINYSVHEEGSGSLAWPSAVTVTEHRDLEGLTSLKTQGK